MKRLFAYHARWNLVWLVVVSLLLIAPAKSAIAAELKEAHVTRIIKEVQLLPAQAAPRPAAVNDNVRGGTAVRTGADSRTELTFTDLTLARLGANTIFSFNEGTRNLDLGGGAVLLQVPKGAGGAKITTAAVTAGITGTTVLMEYHRNAYIKFVVLEGTARMYLKNRLGESVLIGPGQMLIVNPNAKRLPDPVHVDLKRLVQTCLLITEFAPLASQPLILQQIQIQQNNRDLIPTNLVIYGGGTLVSLVDPTNLNVISQETTALATPTPSPSPTPAPTPSKFGTPSVITSPVPYVITSGTTISTDPAITTNGVTDFGKIWRGPVQDGPLSAFIFGSTSAFDTASGFDAELNGNMGGAGFKFTSLQLTGNPTVSTPTGVINLGLIAINGITSGSPGGILTFSGIRGLLFATQNGPINLGSEISFSGLHDLTIYARGSSSDLALGSDINTSRKVRLFAERDLSMTSNITTEELLAFVGRNITIADPAVIHAPTITISAGRDLIWNGQTSDETAVNSDGNVGISAGNQISITGGLEIDRRFGGSSSGLNVSFTAGTDLSAGNSLTILADTSINGNLDSGANITLSTGGNLTINGGGALSLLVANNDGGHIGTGGNISVTTGGNLTADSISVAINNRGGGMIDSGANLVLNIGGTLTTFHNGTDFLEGVSSLTLDIASRYDDSHGNTARSAIGSAATLDFHASSASIGGILNVIISDRGGIIGGNALLNFNVTHGISAQGDATWQVLNDDGPNIASPIGGTIHGNANLQLSAANLSAGSSTVEILNKNSGVSGPGGTIDSDANITLNITGDLSTTQGSLFVRIANNNSGAGSGGVIGSGAKITLNLAGDLITQTDAILLVGNAYTNANAGGSGGMIAKDAIINFSASNASVGGLFEAFIDNAKNGGNGGGTIGGSAIVNLAASGSVAARNAHFQIVNSGGAIGSDATITVNAANITTANTAADSFRASIVNIGGSIGNNGGGSATIDFGLTGDLTTAGDASFEILNNGGSITSNAVVDIRANNISVGGSLNAYIDNTGGTIDDSGGTLTLHVNGAITVTNQMNVLGAVTAGGDITAGTLSSTDVTTTGNIIVGSGGIIRFSIPGEAIENIQHSLTAASVRSQGGINFNGIDGAGTSAPTDGGQLTINANSLNIGTDIVGPVTFNGGSGVNSMSGGANGGTFTVNTTGPITVNSDIEATSGNQPIAFAPAGNGGTVNLNSTNGAVTVNSRIEVSSIPPDTNPPAVRRSARGGNIHIASGKTSAGGVNLSNTGQLLALLNAAAPGPGGTITIMATATTNNSSSINVNGTVEADRGTVDIRHAGDNGQINIMGNATVLADIVKIGAFGTNGQLNIASGLISADTLLKLYAPGSNGQLNFISNVTLGGNSTKILAANAVTIFNNVVVTIGGTIPASVFVNNNVDGVPNANYSGFGGNGATTGTFSGAGANNPLPLSQAPPFGPIGPSRGSARSRDPNMARGKTTGTAINVSSTDALLSLLDGAAPGPGGKITIPASKSASNSRNPSRINTAGRQEADPGALDIQTASSLSARRLPQ
jgi:hypothetical protein